MRDLDAMMEFVRCRTAPAPVPLVEELVLHQADALTPLWHATAAELNDSDPAPFWAFPWAGGQALARYVLDHPELVRDRAVLDVATGSGLVAIAAARAGAARVEAFDVDPFCEAALRLNCLLNGVSVEFRHGDATRAPAGSFDVVLAGDVFYERPLAQGTLGWMSVLAARGTLALVGDPGRIHSPRTGITQRAVYEVPTSPEIESGPSLLTRVLEVLPHDGRAPA